MRGRKPESRATKISRNTFHKNRDGRIELSISSLFGPPVAPDWLTERGAQIWENLTKDAARYGVTDLESTILGNLCNLQGAVADCFKCGEAPPAAVLAEIRRMMQALRIPPRRFRDER